MTATSAEVTLTVSDGRGDGNGPRVRVVPVEPRNSYLIIELEGRQEVGARMPVTGGFLAPVDLANIRNRIEWGARNS